MLIRTEIRVGRSLVGTAFGYVWNFGQSRPSSFGSQRADDDDDDDGSVGSSDCNAAASLEEYSEDHDLGIWQE